ncbi:hypothetical protein QCA50_005390 [Cerrena zonata]|uniref:Uncharacterized protein n=1 Tax=Cerrena zonata TaxID=2478898 RepID=A0AAW0GLK6_9APHY
MPGDLKTNYWRKTRSNAFGNNSRSLLPAPIQLARTSFISRHSHPRGMFSRFTKAFLFIILALFLLASLAFLHPPSRAYIDPWTGDLFGDRGVEQDLHALSSSQRQHNLPGLIEGYCI